MFLMKIQRIIYRELHVFDLCLQYAKIKHMPTPFNFTFQRYKNHNRPLFENAVNGFYRKGCLGYRYERQLCQ